LVGTAIVNIVLKGNSDYG